MLRILRHAQSQSRGFPLRIGVALAAALLLFGSPAVSEDSGEDSAVGAPSPTDTECANAWAESDAKGTCENGSATAEAGLCRIETNCLVTVTSTSPLRDDTDTTAYTEILATQDEVADLHNCGGVLTVGNC